MQKKFTLQGIVSLCLILTLLPPTKLSAQTVLANSQNVAGLIGSDAVYTFIPIPGDWSGSNNDRVINGFL